MNKRILMGHCTILAAAIFSVGGTFLLDYLEQITRNPERLQIIFGITGGVMGFASLMAAAAFYTNNLGDGIKTR